MVKKTKLARKVVVQPLNPVEIEKARQHKHYKACIEIAQHFGRDMTVKEIAQKASLPPGTIQNLAGFLRQNGVEIPHAIIARRCSARFVALEDIKKMKIVKV